jgi:hypothetical protein
MLHPESVGRGREDNRELKRHHVLRGTVHQVFVSDGERSGATTCRTHESARFHLRPCGGETHPRCAVRGRLKNGLVSEGRAVRLASGDAA